MSVLNTFEAVPGRLLSLYEVLFHRENGMEESVLEACATPATLRKTEKTQLFNSPFAEARNMGMVQIEDGRVRLTKEARGGGKPRGDHEKHFRLFLRGVLLDPDRAEAAQQGKFLLALSWLLTRDPLKPIQFSLPFVDAINEEIEDGARALDLSTPSHSQNLLYWARYLGFATIFGGGSGGDDASSRRAIPDPCRAIAEVLGEVFDGPGALAPPQFLERLSAIYPCLEMGRSRETFLNLRKAGRDHYDTKLSIATSLALQRLANQQKLILSNPADAAAVILDFGVRQRRVSRIEPGSAV